MIHGNRGKEENEGEKTIPGHSLVNQGRKGHHATWNDTVEYVVDGTHEAHMALMLRDARVTP
jgi:hypothetical protein